MLRTLCAALSITIILGQGHAMALNKTNLTLVSPWEVASYDPAVSGFTFQSLQLMENLVDADVDGALRPGLATYWSVSDDGLAWTFELRTGVTFHDGSPFNAAAVTQVLTRAWEQPGVLKKAPINGISEANGAVVITLERPFTALPALLAHATTIIPSPTAFDDEGNPTALIGTGPFKANSFTPPQSLTMVRNDTYWGVVPKLTDVTYLAVGRAETRALMAESGDADMVFTLDPSGYARLQKMESLRMSALPIPRVVTLKVNASHPFLSDPRARRALSLAINRDGIATAITRFPEAAASQLFPPALSAWHDQNLDPLGHDPAAAKALLADVGVELEVSVASFSEIPAGHQDGTLQVALFARNYGLTPDPIGTVLSDFGAGGGDWGAMGWENATVAKALEMIAATSDMTIRRQNIREVAQTLHSELPMIPIVWYQLTVAVADGLENVVIDPLERTYGLNMISWQD